MKPTEETDNFEGKTAGETTTLTITVTATGLIFSE